MEESMDTDSTIKQIRIYDFVDNFTMENKKEEESFTIKMEF